MNKERKLRDSQRRAEDLYTTETRTGDSDALGMHSAKLAISYENQTETLHAPKGSVFTRVSLPKPGTTVLQYGDKDKFSVVT